MPDTWQAATARHRFSELLDAAVEGRPQFVRRRDGHEVVVVSREYFEQTRPTLKSVLQSFRFGERNDAFDATLAEARTALGVAVQPRGFQEAPAGDNPSGHEHPE